MYAASNGHTEAIEVLARHGALMNTLSKVSSLAACRSLLFEQPVFTWQLTVCNQTGLPLTLVCTGLADWVERSDVRCLLRLRRGGCAAAQAWL